MFVSGITESQEDVGSDSFCCTPLLTMDFKIKKKNLLTGHSFPQITVGCRPEAEEKAWNLTLC